MLKVMPEGAEEGRAGTPPDERLELETGEAVTVEAGRRVRIESAAGELIFAYDPEQNVTTVSIPEGDLRFVTQKGDIELDAAGDLRLRGDRRVEVQGALGVKLETGTSIGGEKSRVEVKPRRLRLDSPEIGVRSDRGLFDIRALRVASQRFRGTVEEAKLVANKLTTVSDTVRQKAKTVFQTVEGLVQTRAQRARTLVEESIHLKGRMLFLKAKKDAKINGERIHLG